jgi:hypothetical protein
MANPNDRKNRPFIVDGEYPPADADGFSDEFQEEQSHREYIAKHESGPLYGDYPHHPDRAMPRSPEMYAEEMKREEELRAMHGGLPDAPEAIRPSNPKPWKGLKG